MRAVAMFILGVGAASCSLAVDTSDLSGGTRPLADSASTPSDSSTDTGTCDREECVSDVHTVALAEISPCNGAATTDAMGCRAKVAEYCRSLDPCCYRGGYGPVELPNATTATVVCLYDDSYDAPTSEITASNSKCLASALASRECDIAAHTSAKKRGHGTGIVQKNDGTNAVVLGVNSDNVDIQTATWAELTALESGCTAAAIDSFACTRAVQRFCTTGEANEGNLGGYGPVAYTSTETTVVCLW